MAMTLIRSHWRCTFQSFGTAENVTNSTNCVVWAWGWNFYPFLHGVQVPWIIDNLWTWLLTPQKIESRPSLGQMVCELRKLLCNQRINVSIRLQLCLMCVVSIVQARCAMHQNHVRYKSLALPNAQNRHRRHLTETGQYNYWQDLLYSTTAITPSRCMHGSK